MRPVMVLVMAMAAALGCGDNADGLADAGATIDAGGVDAGADAAPVVPVAGFGAITGECGVLTPVELDGATALWFGGRMAFDNRYDDPGERGLLTAGGAEIIADGNAGGSSLYSEVFAYEWLARCELATLLKTETEIRYDIEGKKADLLVEIDGRTVGVSVTRVVAFPFGSELTVAAASTLIDRKLDDLRLATGQVAAVDRWTSQVLAILAYNDQHAAATMDAWSRLDADSRGSTLLIVVVTDGDDLFIYTDR